MKLLSLAMVFFLVAFALTADANAQRRGGGRSFSAGGSRSLPSGGMNRSSRSSDFNRGGNQSFGGSSFGNLNNRQPSSNTRSFSMPNSFPTSGNNAGNRRSEPRSLNQERLGGNFNNGLTDRANRQFESPTQNQLNDFLNMPGTSTGRQRNGGNSSPNDYNGKTYQGDNYTIDTYKRGGSGTTKGGVDYGGAAGGIVVTDAQGNKRVVGGSVGAASDGTNAVAGRGGYAGGKNTDGSAAGVRGGSRVATDGESIGASRTVVGGARDAQGNVRGGASGGYIGTDGNSVVAGAGAARGQSNVDGSGGYAARGGRMATDGTNTIVQRGGTAGVRDSNGNARGVSVGGMRATDGYNTYARGGAARYVAGPGGNVYAAGRYAAGYNGIVTSYGQAAAVRMSFGGYHTYYNPRWYARYPGAWYAAGIATAAWWLAPSYGYASGYCGCNEAPVSYQYGDGGIYVENGNVYIGEDPIASEEEYYNQAVTIADNYSAVDNPEDADDWMPLGVFAVVTPGQTKSDLTLQLALNKDGMIRGNLSVGLTDEVIQVKGSVDKETQRVAFKLVGKEDILIEAGLYNLTEDVLTVMVHRGDNRQEERGLIRLQEGDEKE